MYIILKEKTMHVLGVHAQIYFTLCSIGIYEKKNWKLLN